MYYLSATMIPAIKRPINDESYCGLYCEAELLSDPLLLVLRSRLAPALVLAAVLALLM